MNARVFQSALLATGLLSCLPAGAVAPGPLSAAHAAVAAAAAPGTRTFHAAGNVFVVVDGVIVRATMAPPLPPAPGFAYER